MPLSRKILGLAVLNLVLLCAVIAVFVQWQFGWSLEALVLGLGRDRVLVIANSFGRDLEATPYGSRGELLSTYSQNYKAEFLLAGPRGESLMAGQAPLPEELVNRLRRTPPPRGKGPPGKGKGLIDRDPRFQPPPERGPPPEAPFFVLTHGPLRYWVGVPLRTTGPDGELGLPAVLLLRSTSIFNPQLFFDWRVLMWLAVSLAAVALLCWWPFVHGVTRTIAQMGRATEEIAQGRFGSQIAEPRNDELGHLGQQINRMAGRLDGFVKHQKRFLGDIAHELCAPIARIQFALGILEQKAGEEQQSHVAVLREEIQEMSGLVNELLLFSKAAMQPAGTPLMNVDLHTAVKRAVSRQLPGSSTIDMHVGPGLVVLAHEPYLVRAISNLLRNALRYAGEDGPILVSARSQADEILLTVADCGPGLPEDRLEEVFEPFYRLEVERSRDTGGAGLGLAIVKSCIEACHGTVICRNRKPVGLEVTISLTAGN